VLRKAFMENSSDKFPVTIIILTLNEGANIGPCLSYLNWADEVIIVDSFSTDDTKAQAIKHRADVRYFESKFEDFGQQRNWAIDNTQPKHEWVLFLDADERCNKECENAIRRVIEKPDGHVGYYFCYRNYFLGTWIKHCTLFPSWQLRLLKRGEVRYRKEGHGQREVTTGKLGYIKEPYDHLDLSKGVADWLAKHNAYSSNEVELVWRLAEEPYQLGDLFKSPIERRRCLKRIAARLKFGRVFRFFYIYIIRGGFLDGKAGLIYCLLRLSQEIHVIAKLAEASYLAKTHESPTGEHSWEHLSQATIVKLPSQATTKSASATSNRNAVQYHNDIAHSWESRYKKRSFRRREHILDVCLPPEDITGQRWLDVGCGTGRLSRALARRGCDVVGFDASPEMIRVAEAESKAEQLVKLPEFRLLSVEEMSGHGDFDGVLCNSVVEYLADPESCIAACAASLRPGGKLLMSVPNCQSLLRRTLLLTYRISKAITGNGWPQYLALSENQYRPKDFAALLKRNGLTIQRTSFFGGPFPTWIQDLRYVGSLFMCVAEKPAATSKNQPESA